MVALARCSAAAALAATLLGPALAQEDPELEASVKRMAKIGRAFSPSFSPDGGKLALVSDLTGLGQVWVVSSRGGWPELVTSFDDPVGAVRWSAAGDLAVTVAPGGGMNTQLYLMRPDGSELRRVTLGGEDNNWLGDFELGGKLLSFASNRESASAMEPFLYDVESGETKVVARGSGTASVNDVSRDGKRALVYRVPHRGDSDLYLVELASGAETLLTPHEGPGTFGQGQFSSDGATVFLVSDKDRERTALASIRTTEGAPPGPMETIAARDDAELSTFKLAPDGSTAALIWNVAGKSQLEFIELGTGQRTPAPPLPGELIGGLEFSKDGQQLAFVASGATRPTDVWVLDRSGAVTRITQSAHVGVALDSLVTPELRTFRAHDGLELSGWLYRPRDRSGPGPLVLSFHGGPEGQERPGFDHTYQALLSRGIGVFAPNVRGSSGFGKTFVNLDNGALRKDAVKDIAACLEHVISSGAADPKRIGIMGGSYGGYMTMAGLAEYPDRFAAAVNMFGVVNFASFFAHTQPWMAAVSKIEYGDPEAEAELLKELSPLSRIDRVRAPTLVLHGANDTNVPVVEAEQVVAELRKTGVPVEYILFPDEGHGFRKEANRIRSTVALVRWFEEHLVRTP